MPLIRIPRRIGQPLKQCASTSPDRNEVPNREGADHGNDNGNPNDSQVTPEESTGNDTFDKLHALYVKNAQRIENDQSIDKILRHTAFRRAFASYFTIFIACVFVTVVSVAFLSPNPVKFLLELISSTYSNIIIAIAAIMLTVGYIYLKYTEILSNKPNEFIDIDQNKNLRFAHNGTKYRIFKDELNTYNTPYQYFISIIYFFEEKVAEADQKASLLLDKGTKYARRGIYFYIFSIVAWQVAFHFVTDQTHPLYGIGGCSLVFVFVEFISAWFLKQYRQYIDTSLYLVKIKSIFERYILIYLSINESKNNNIDYIDLLEPLKEDIKWPDTYLTKNPDVSFAKECMETATQLIRAVKSEANSKPKKD